MGFFNSNKNRMGSIGINRRGRMRSPYAQNRRMMKMMTYDHINGNNALTNNNLGLITVTSKQEQDAIDLGFVGYSLKHGDIMIIGDIQYMLPDFKHDGIDPNIHNLIRNNVFEGILCDKVGLVYSPRKKQFMYLAVNDNYSLAVLFKNEDINQLPNIENIDLDNLHPNIQILYNVNRLLNSVYDRVQDLTDNPIHIYKINEIFKR